MHQDWWMFSLNKWSNNFRRSYSRGVIFTLFSGLFFYILYLIAMDGNLRLCFDDCNTLDSLIYAWDKYAYQFAEFLNPVHKVDFLKEDLSPLEKSPTLKFFGSIADFAGRIFVGFGIYQTIQAFRKYGKSGDK